MCSGNISNTQGIPSIWISSMLNSVFPIKWGILTQSKRKKIEFSNIPHRIHIYRKTLSLVAFLEYIMWFMWIELPGQSRERKFIFQHNKKAYLQRSSRLLWVFGLSCHTLAIRQCSTHFSCCDLSHISIVLYNATLCWTQFTANWIIWFSVYNWF